MSEVLRKFNRYFLLDHLAQGGMAEIYRARMNSLDATGRILVIKRIQNNLGQNQNFKQMFLEETKVMMGFSHPNLISLYDFGEETGQPFIAMEYVHGKNLRHIANRAIQQRGEIPIEFTVGVVEEVASGLYYAHHYRDPITQKSLQIVHRDVSPQNILVGYDGQVKIIDFGIAKAEIANKEATQVGTIKGKPSYMSPEQVRSEALDGRSDLFSLGIVLWELLTGKKLFSADHDLAILRMVDSSQDYVVPPSKMNPKVPKELDELVLKALSNSKEGRFQNCQELQSELRKFRLKFYPDYTPQDRAEYQRALFSKEIEEDQKTLQDLSRKVERLMKLATQKSNPDKSETTISQALDLDLDQKSRERIQSPRVELTDHANLKKINPLKAPQAPQLVKEKQEFSVPLDLNFLELDKSDSKQHTLHTKRIDSNRVVGVNHKKGSEQKPFPWSGLFRVSFVASFFIALAYVVVKPQVLSEVSAFQNVGPIKTIQDMLFIARGMKIPSETQDNREVSSETSEPTTNSNVETEQRSKLYFKVDVFPSLENATVTFQGKKFSSARDMFEVQVDQWFEIKIEKQGYRLYRKELVVDSSFARELRTESNGSKLWVMKVDLEPLSFGYLSLKSEPPAEITWVMDGKPVNKRTPLEQMKLPVGTYTMKLINSALGLEKTVQVDIEEGKITSSSVRLESRID